MSYRLSAGKIVKTRTYRVEVELEAVVDERSVRAMGLLGGHAMENACTIIDE